MNQNAIAAMSSICQMLLVILCFIFVQKFVDASPWDPYTFGELIKRGVVKLDSNVKPGEPLFINNQDIRLKYDYDFSLSDDEKIKIIQRDDKWNAEMAEMRNDIKDARIRQRELYRQMMSLIFERKFNHEVLGDKILELKREIEDEDELIEAKVTYCNDLDDHYTE